MSASLNSSGVNKRKCLYCTKEFDGRPDKKFCHYNCRNGFNNKKYKQSVKPTTFITYSININLKYMSTSPSSTIKVAFADDHIMIRECLFNCLTLWGYSVIIQACNGKDLINQITDDNLPDICILDINMPELNGYETIKILNKSWPDIKIMVFSLSIVKGINDKVAGAHAVVSKADGLGEIKAALALLTEPKAVMQQ